MGRHENVLAPREPEQLALQAGTLVRKYRELETVEPGLSLLKSKLPEDPFVLSQTPRFW